MVKTKGFDQRNKHPLHHSVICALNNVANFQSRPNEMGTQSSQRTEDPLIKVSESKELQGLMSQESDPKNDYLCTNFHAYLTHEPCTMCAMALLHARIAKVFYLFATTNGYLNTRCKLHCMSELNHTYEAFRAIDLDNDEWSEYFSKTNENKPKSK